MARIIDPAKIENIKKATMEIVIEQGYTSATIAAIAKKAGVSIGYLYRHHSGKNEFMEEFVHMTNRDFLHYSYKLMKNSKNIKDFIYKHITYLIDMANTNPTQLKFHISLIFDIRYIKRKEFIDLELKIAKEFLEKGIKTGEINSEFTVEELISIYPTIPLKYLGLIMSQESPKILGTKEVERLVKMCLNAIK